MVNPGHTVHNFHTLLSQRPIFCSIGGIIVLGVHYSHTPHRCRARAKDSFGPFFLPGSLPACRHPSRVCLYERVGVSRVGSLAYRGRPSHAILPFGAPPFLRTNGPASGPRVCLHKPAGVWAVWEAGISGLIWPLRLAPRRLGICLYKRAGWRLGSHGARHVY